MEAVRIRDPGWKPFESWIGKSRIPDKNPGSATLLQFVLEMLLTVAVGVNVVCGHAPLSYRYLFCSVVSGIGNAAELRLKNLII
jgi:hypothetical protein